MFQFTTTNVINSAYENGYAGEDQHIIWSAGKDAEGGEDLSVLVLKRIGTFKANEVSEIDRAMPVTAKKAVAKVNLYPKAAQDKVAEGKGPVTLRLNLYVGISQGSNDAMYANDYWFKGKPLVIEYTAAGKDTAKNFIKNVKKFLLNVCDEKWIDFDYEDNYLIITMTNEYQRFRNISVEMLNPEAYHGMGEWTVINSIENGEIKEIKYDSEEDLASKLESMDANRFFAGREGFGTSDFILHNLRIPTSANSRWLSVHEDERPVEGANYIQYTIHQCADRGPLGLNAVGQHVTSTTTHVLYVREDLQKSFETVLKDFVEYNEIKMMDVLYTPYSTTGATVETDVEKIKFVTEEP